MRVSSHEAIAATGARAFEIAALPAAFGVATDTRTLLPGDAFLALRGERFDGHAFVAAALAAGASALVVDDARVVPPGVPALVVADTALAYLALGGLARRAIAGSVVAITGSAGKTTTKAFLAQLLEREAPGRVAATIANENNELGVAKLLLAARPDAAYVVAEFGARHFGEIEPLARAAMPDVAVLTNVGEAHLEIMGSPERLAETKWGIFATGARPVLGANDAVSRACAGSLERSVTWFALDDERVELGPDDTLVRAIGRERIVVSDARGERDARVALAIDGEHNRRNVAAALAAGIALGVPLERLAAGLGELALPQGRYERIALGPWFAIFDAYNASPSGTLATLESFAREAAQRRIAVLASMAELGPDAAEMHRRVGNAAAHSGLDAILVGGEFGPQIARGAREAGFDPERVVPFARNVDAIAWLQANARSGDLVLFKGSRRYRLEEIVEGLRRVDAGR